MKGTFDYNGKKYRIKTTFGGLINAVEIGVHNNRAKMNAPVKTFLLIDTENSTFSSLKKLDVPLTEIPDGTMFLMTSTRYNNVKNKVVKLCGPEAIHPDDPDQAKRPLAYFTFVDRSDSVDRETFIKGMRESICGSTLGVFCLWQDSIEEGWVILEYLNLNNSK